MSKRNNIWVSPHPEGWQVHKEKSERASLVVPTQGPAIQAAIKQATKENGQVIIQGRDGKIRSVDSYGNESKKKDTEH